MVEEKKKKLDLDEFRLRRDEMRDFDLEIICNAKSFLAYKELFSSRSEFIRSRLSMTDDLENIEINEIDSGMMEKIIKVFYDEEPLFDESELYDAFKGLELLLLDDSIDDLIEKIAEITNMVELTVETFRKLWVVENKKLHSILIRALANRPKRYAQIYRSLDEEELKTIIKEKALLFYDSKGNPLIYESYWSEYKKFIGSIISEPVVVKQMLDFVQKILKERSEKKSNIFYGIPTKLFIYSEEFGIHPKDSYPRIKTEQSTLPSDCPAYWHLEKIEFLVVAKFQDRPTINGFETTYRHMKTKETFSFKNNFSGTKSTLELEKAEYITDFTLHHSFMIDYMELITNKGKVKQCAENVEGNLFSSNIREIKTAPYKESANHVNKTGDIVLTNLFGFQYSLLKSDILNDCRFIFAGFINYN